VIDRRPSLLILALLGVMLCGAFTVPRPLEAGDHVLNVTGRALDMNDKPLDSVRITIDMEGKVIDEQWADTRGRFAFTLNIGGFYGVEVAREGYILKRFIIDSRTEDPSKIITGPLATEVNLRPRSDLAYVDVSELELPYALITYSKKDRSFIADEAYIAEMKKVEAALMLSSARAKKRSAQ
jgi:hypothetical protein